MFIILFRYCSACNRYVGLFNKHCSVCDCCTSKVCDERVAISLSFLDYYRMVDHTTIVVSVGFA